MRHLLILVLFASICFAQYDRCDTSIVKNDTAVVCTSFFSSGNVEWINHYFNGKLSGITKSFYNNGQLSGIMRYEHGCLVDTVKEYHPNGAKKRVAPYKNCEWDGTTYVWDSTGTLIAEWPYNNGKRIGVHRKWYPDGKLKEVAGFDSLGQKDGLTGEYYSDGKPKWEAQYEKGNIKESHEFYENGQQKSERVYEPDGKRIKSAKYFSPEGTPWGEIKNGNGNYLQCIPGAGCRKFFYEDGKQVKFEVIKEPPAR